MKKFLIKAIVFSAVFVASLMIFSAVLNQDHDNLTMEIAPASLPVITMESNGMLYNQLYGYTTPRDVTFLRDHITMLGENRDSGFVVDTYGQEVRGISMQVRSRDGSRLIENTAVTEYRQMEDQLQVAVTLKDLIERDTEYSLTLVLEMEDGKEVYYYTTVLWSEQQYAMENLAFVQDFHEKLYDREAAKELTKYLETNSKLEDNSSFHKVNIHSSFKQVTWGDLQVKEVGEPILKLTSVSGSIAAVLVDYMVKTEGEEAATYYKVQEYYRVRSTSDRMYLLDYERTMTQIPDVKHMYANDKILLGITGEDISLQESEDGNIVVFEVAGRLCSYDVTNNKLTVIFSFYDEESYGGDVESHSSGEGEEQLDARELNAKHAIKILNVYEGGNVRFAVYGYMNRGRHEGEIGIQLYSYDSTLNTIEELVYIPYEKSFEILQTEMEQLLYLNREQLLYVMLEDAVYEVNLIERTYNALINVTRDDSVLVSDSHNILVWQDGNSLYHSGKLSVKNLNTGAQGTIRAEEGEAIRPLGFMGEDVIYGIAREEDIVEETIGKVFFPMYKICICDANGEILKEYQQDNIYITACRVADNQITLERLVRNAGGGFQETIPDHIMNNVEKEEGKNKIVAANIDVYEKYVQIKTKSAIDGKTIKILTPKEVVFEGGRKLLLEAEGAAERFYVYGPYGVEDIFYSPGRAVSLAYEKAGMVINRAGKRIWHRSLRVNRNQIMAIKEEKAGAEQTSLSVCLDTILKFEGIIRDSAELLLRGQTVTEILQENLPNAEVLELGGCGLDSVLYYVNMDIPVLALLNNGKAVLVTGFNEFNVVILDPSAGTLSKMGMNDATKWFAENGNYFVTYMINE